MDVFLIPTTTSDRYALYYEAADDVSVEVDTGGLLNRMTFGWSLRLKRHFEEMLREAEEWRHRRHEAQPAPAGVLSRARRKVMGFIVERIAEQRLLWQLRKATDVCIHVPTDLVETAEEVVRPMLRHDADHHRKWFWIDFVLLLLCLPLVVIPGPNVPGFYFTFQVVSHYLSWTGAKNGLALRWSVIGCVELSELREAMCLAPGQRQPRFHDIADRLRLEHLPTFLEDVAAPPA